MFEISQECVVEHVNVRRGNNDEAPVAVDVNLSCEDFYLETIVDKMHRSAKVTLTQLSKDLFDGDDEDEQAPVTKTEPQQQTLQ